MKHGVFLCFVTRIVEKSWKVSELRKTAYLARSPKTFDAKTMFPGKLQPKQPPISDTLTGFLGERAELSSRFFMVFHDFSTI